MYKPNPSAKAKAKVKDKLEDPSEKTHPVECYQNNNINCKQENVKNPKYSGLHEQISELSVL